MEFPSRYPDSPLPSQHGPSRNRLPSRQNRLSNMTPYQRPTNPNLPNPTTTSSANPTRRNNQQQSNNSNYTNAPAARSNPSGFFSSLRKTITKPLSWLSNSTSSALDQELSAGLPSSSSTDTIVSRARKAAQSRAAQDGNPFDSGKMSSTQIRNVGAKLGTGGRQVDVGDLESSADPESGRLTGFATGERRDYQRRGLAPPPQRTSGLAASASTPAGFSGMQSSGTPKRYRFNLQYQEEDEIRTGRSPSPAMSSASAAVEAAARLRLSRNSEFRRSSSLRPGDSLSEYGGETPPQRNLPTSFNFGSERRFLTPSKAASSSGSQLSRTQQTYTLPSKSPLSRPVGRSSLGTYAASDTGFRSGSRPPGNYTYAASSVAGSNSSRSRAGSVVYGGGSLRGGTPGRSGSVFGGSATAGRTPKKREWSSLGLQPSTTTPRTEGERLMKEYNLMNNGAGAARFLQSRGERERTGTPSSSGKRGTSLMDQEDEDVTGSASKRRMIYDPAKGFISYGALKAPEASAANETERELNAFESMPSMRTPLGEARREGSTRSHLANAAARIIPVPSPAPDRSTHLDSITTDFFRRDRSRSASVAPATRARERSLNASRKSALKESSSMRSRTRRGADEVETSRDSSLGPSSSRDTPSRSRRNRMEVDDEPEQEEDDEEEEEEEEVVEQPVRRQTRSQVKNQESSKVSAPARSTRSSRQTASTHGTPALKGQGKQKQAEIPSTRKSPSKGKGKAKTQVEDEEMEVEKEDEAPPLPESSPQEKVTSTTFAPSPLNPSVSSSKFSIRDDSTPQRTSSSLRQGAEKKFRTHEKSGGARSDGQQGGKAGRFGLDDEGDEQEDLPDTEALKAIKLPPTSFPQGFTFGISSTSTNQAQPPASTSTPVPATAATSTTAETFSSSLLSRMEPRADAAPKDSSTPAPEASKGGFSFKTAPIEQPKPKLAFSFTPINAAGSSPSTSSSPAPASAAGASVFFKAPTSGTTQPSAEIDNQRKSGPVPIFFGAATAKSASPSPAPAPAPAFSFGQPPAKTEEKAASPAPSFSLGPPASTGSAPPSNSNIFAKPGASAESAPSSAISFAGLPSNTNGSSTPFAGFGKRSNEDDSKDSGDADGERSSKKRAAGSEAFSFGAQPATSTPTTQSSVPNFFGNTSSPAVASASKPQAFNAFGQPSSIEGASQEKKETAPMFGTPQPAEKASTPFAFSTPSTSAPAAAGDLGGGDGSAMDVSPQALFNSNHASSSNSPAPPPAPVFNFGAPAVAAPKPNTPFSFGVGSNDSKPVTSSPGPVFGGFGASSNQSQAPAPTSSAGTFTFQAPASGTGPFGGAPSGTSTPTGQPPVNGFGFTFGGQQQQQQQQQQPQQGVFAFGAGGSNGTGTGAAGSQPFVFGGAPAPTSQPQQQNAPFTFNAPSPGFGGGSVTSPTTGSSPTPFAFGAAQPQQAPSPFGQQPQQQQPATPPAAPIMFNMGTSTPSNNPSGGRNLKRLPRRG